MKISINNWLFLGQILLITIRKWTQNLLHRNKRLKRVILKFKLV